MSKRYAAGYGSDGISACIFNRCLNVNRDGEEVISEGKIT